MPYDTKARKKLGAAGEEMAAKYLAEAGMIIIARNWRCLDRGLPGEIDIIAEESAPDLVQDGDVVPWRILVEVRTRRGDAFGTALQSVTPQKAQRMRSLAAAWVQDTAWRGPWRIDVVAIQMDSRGLLRSFDHLRGAVGG